MEQVSKLLLSMDLVELYSCSWINLAMNVECS